MSQRGDVVGHTLVADVGGTYTRIALFTPRGERKFYQRFENRHYPSISTLLHDFRKHNATSITAASIAVAGPVSNGEALLPNLAWHVSVPLIMHVLKVKKVALHNDAFAAAAAIDDAPSVIIRKGRSLVPAPRAIIGPGTGLGVALSIPAGTSFVPVATEAGHMDFAPTTEVQREFWQHLHGRYGHIAVERALAGHAILELYHFLREKKIASESTALRDAIEAAPDKVRAVVDAGLARTDGVAQRTLEEYVGMLGAFCGSYALAAGSRGGIHLYGTLANRLATLIGSDIFFHPFASKGRMRRYCEKIPIVLVKDTDIVLRGAWLLHKSM